jgi:hypothetical protein
MNDFDLESKLKSVRVPERSDEYWDDFPARVRMQLGRERGVFTPRPAWRPRLAWAGGLALTVAVLSVCLDFHLVKAVSVAIDRHEGRLHAQLARLDAGLHKLVLNTDGMGYLLSEPN